MTAKEKEEYAVKQIIKERAKRFKELKERIEKELIFYPSDKYFIDNEIRYFCEQEEARRDKEFYDKLHGKEVELASLSLMAVSFGHKFLQPLARRDPVKYIKLKEFIKKYCRTDLYWYLYGITG